MRKFVTVVIIYLLFVVISFISYKDGIWGFKLPDTLAIFSGILSLYVLYEEYSNRNKDNDRSIYIQPLLFEFATLRDLENKVDIINKMSIHDPIEKRQDDLNNLQKSITNLALRISNRLQQADQRFNLKNKKVFEDFLEEKVYNKCVHLSQNSLKDYIEITTFQNDANELKSNILNLENLLNGIINQISDAL